MKAGAKQRIAEHEASVRDDMEAEYADALADARTTARKHVKKSALATSRLKRLRRCAMLRRTWTSRGTGSTRSSRSARPWTPSPRR